MANKSQPEWVQKFIRHVHAHGRLTASQAEEISGFTRRALQHYLREAVLLGSLFRTPKHGIFISKDSYHAWLAEQNKARTLARERAREAAELALEGIKNSPYDPQENVICQECRNSAAMRRVLSFYGVRND